MAEAARRACVVLCCASGVGGRHRILRQGREGGEVVMDAVVAVVILSLQARGVRCVHR
jgi:hypothetical protein